MLITVTTGWCIICVQSCSVGYLFFFALYKNTNGNLLLLTTTKPSAVTNPNSSWSYYSFSHAANLNISIDCEDRKWYTRQDLTRRVGILFYIYYTGHKLWSYSMGLCSQTIGMTKTLPSPVIIQSSNHSDEQWLYLAGEAVSAVENTLSYFLCSLVFQMVEINCMACWWAPEMPFLFWFKANRQLFQTTENLLLHTTESCQNIIVILTNLHRLMLLSSSMPKKI